VLHSATLGGPYGKPFVLFAVYNSLRPMTDPAPRKLIIAIDGPAGAGKRDRKSVV